MSFKTRDRIFRYISLCGSFRLSVIIGSNLVQEAKTLHNLDEYQAALLGELLCACALSASLLKDNQIISANIKNQEHQDFISAEAHKTGEVRGFINMELYHKMGLTNHAEIEKILKDGTLNITHWKNRVPKNSYTKMEYGHIIRDFCDYYLQSEQISTYMELHSDQILTNNKKFVWGYILQLLPDFDASKANSLTKILKQISNTSDQISQTHPQQDIITLFDDFELKLVDKYPIDFYCRCSKKSFAQTLISLGTKELDDMAHEGTQEIICHYCSSKYYFSPDDLKKLIKT